MNRRALIDGALVVALAALPLILQAIDQGYYIGFASRILIFAIAASSLNLILGTGGLLSFGHAAYLGIGAYAVAILSTAGITSAWIAWPFAITASALAALIIGAICLRTRGVYFIMITLAFAQMMYYAFISLKALGGDDGLNLPERSVLGFGIDPKDDLSWYYVCLALLLATLFSLDRIVLSRFGRALEAMRENEGRMEAIGFATYHHRLVGFVIAGALAGLAGALMANQSAFVSPKLMHWVQSGTLMVMVILGGVGHRLGGLLGATVLLGLEEAASGYTIHWQLLVGAVLLAVVLLAPRGIAGAFTREPRS